MKHLFDTEDAEARGAPVLGNLDSLLRRACSVLMSDAKQVCGRVAEKASEKPYKLLVVSHRLVFVASPTTGFVEIVDEPGTPAEVRETLH